MTKIYLASDHAGYELKEFLEKNLAERGLAVTDLGTTSGTTSVDYPDYADKLALALHSDPQAVGILVCGSGQGMCMRANRYPHVRAALVWNEEVARLARAHNNANVICLGGRLTSREDAWSWLQVFLQTPFEGGRHEQRVRKLGLLRT